MIRRYIRIDRATSVFRLPPYSRWLVVVRPRRRKHAYPAEYYDRVLMDAKFECSAT